MKDEIVAMLESHITNAAKECIEQAVRGVAQRAAIAAITG
jgi:hypothetical protein